jgi:hypothetical protein
MLSATLAATPDGANIVAEPLATADPEQDEFVKICAVEPDSALPITFLASVVRRCWWADARHRRFRQRSECQP